MADLIFPEESRELLRIAMQLHNEIGSCFSEKVYQDAFEVLLKENGIPYVREHHLSINFHGVTLGHDFFVDFLCYGKIMVELKAHKEVLGEFESQVINYTHVGNCQLGLLLNFGMPSLFYKFYPNRPDYSISR